MLPFVGVALKVCQELNIADKHGQQMVMRFAKLYTPEKMGDIMRQAQTYPWSFQNPTAAFMKAVGEINKQEKENGNVD